MNYHLILTDECNLCCTYCRGKLLDNEPGTVLDIAVDENLPTDLSVDIDTLCTFLRGDPDCSLTFYGGEPLLRRDLIEEIMRRAPAATYLLHTNGILLDRLDSSLRNRLSTIHISIDGPEALTDRHRGNNTYATVIRNLRQCREEGYPGEIIGRMTVTEDCDIEKTVRYLSENEDFPFSSLHWQMDANFWYDYSRRSFEEWANSSYNPGIRRLVRYWVDTMKERGEVMRWYPFIVPISDMIAGHSSRLRCGAGHASYSIMTDGTIIPCPCMVGLRDYYLGTIATTAPRSLPAVEVPGPCRSCELAGFCGGRCLYSAITRPWPVEGMRAVCGTVKNLHDALRSVLPEVNACLEAGDLSEEDFSAPRYNGCEIIP